MPYIIENIIQKIEQINPTHAHKLLKNMAGMEFKLFLTSDLFLKRYNDYLQQQGLTLDYAVDCYLKMYSDMLEQRWMFTKTGKYSNTSFEEVNKNIYHNEDVMDYHMNGLVLAQFLWFDQYERFKFFSDNIHKYTHDTKRYLEIGGGHGLYTLEALRQLPNTCRFDCVDVSPLSIQLAKGIVNNKRVNFLLQDIFYWDNTDTVDFFTMGEVLEHLENPLQMLKKLKVLIKNGGFGFITTPVNSPMIDHIYLFKSVAEIQTMLQDAGFKIMEDKTVISEHISSEEAQRLKVPIMYAAFVS